MWDAARQSIAALSSPRLEAKACKLLTTKDGLAVAVRRQPQAGSAEGCVLPGFDSLKWQASCCCWVLAMPRKEEQKLHQRGPLRPCLGGFAPQ